MPGAGRHPAALLPQRARGEEAWKGRGQALGVRLTFVRLLQEPFQVGRHEVRLFGRTVVTLQVFHCKEKPPPRAAVGGADTAVGVAATARSRAAEGCYRSSRPNKSSDNYL